MTSMSARGNGGVHISFEDFCSLYKELLASNGISPHLFRSLHHKLENEVYDAGDFFILTRNDDDDGLKPVVSCEDGIQVTNSDGIFLIDHAWTYRIGTARKQLCEAPGLLQRIAEMMGYSVHGEVFNPDDDIVNDILKELWKYNQTYSVAEGSAEEKMPVWYIMDEFGSQIKHSDSPNIAVVPFFYQATQTPYSLMWLLTDLDYGDEIRRDFCIHEKDSIRRKCMLLPWQPADLTYLSSKTELFLDRKYEERFKFSQEILPQNECREVVIKQRLRVYLDFFKEYLTDVINFEIVEDESEADVLFAGKRVKNFHKYSYDRPDVWLFQFPCEEVLFCKDFFMDIGKRCGKDGNAPLWLPVSFDLQNELPQFVSYFQQQAALKFNENCWICKPWNLARGLGIQVSNDLNEIIRLRETSIPLVVSKYVEDPVLIVPDDCSPPVKFDLKFVILVTSIHPLKVHACECVHPRLANKGFALNNFDDFEQHCTAMVYSDANTKYDIFHEEFIQLFEKQYEDHKWEDVHKRVCKCISEFMKSATSRPPPYGVGQYPRSRAIYSFDVLLEWKTEQTGTRYMQPVLLECNFMPCLNKQCTKDPSFLNNIFKYLFWGDEACSVVDISDL